MAATSSDALPSLSFPPLIFKKLQPLEYLRRHLSLTPSVRPSGRTPLQAREVSVSLITLGDSTFGSVIRWGETAVVAGVRGELCEPDVRKPAEGFIVPNVDLSPLAHPKFRPGPPSALAQSLSSRIYSILSIISPSLASSLSVVPGKLAWALYIDIQFLTYDGNPFDSAWLAVSSALSFTTLPYCRWDEDLQRGVIDPLQPARSLSAWAENENSIYACTFVSIDHGRYILIDPDNDEEELSDESITIVTGQGDDNVRAIWMDGEGVGKEVSKCVELARERGGYLGFVTGVGRENVDAKV